MIDEPFDLEPVNLPEPPDVPGIVHVLDSADEAIDLLLADVLETADRVVGERGRFDLVVSGDRQLDSTWLRMMLDPDLRTFPWHATHLWFPDVGGAAEDAVESVHARLQESLILPSGLEADHVHPIPQAPAESIASIRDGLGERPFDAAVLAIAADGGVIDCLPPVVIERVSLLGILVIGQGGADGIKVLEQDPDQASDRVGRCQDRLRWYVG
ncbi:MAG: 6-phosphogluconolactonase [Phycisphaerales bacterium]|jgi:hypothetical protein|nr:6-phosphogluconolactonase [Phycisphaerales bacterium]MDP6890148.1 6-phosphogluconolactonase [Phycisphaerales bacterium]